ncbi:MAG: hypothetical protein R8K46_09625 [Mariprofundaceae bacterium]
MSVVVVLLGVGCATTAPPPPDKPCKVEQDIFYEKTETIALAPLVDYSDLEPSEQVISKFELLIEKKLSEAGFSVVPSKEYRDIRKRMIEQVGGYFDPETGKRDETKFKTVNEHSLREINRKFNADAVLFPTIVIVKVPFYSGPFQILVEWDGVREQIDTRGGFIRFLDTSTKSGTVGALSLVVVIKDITETALYVNRGGIQVP